MATQRMELESSVAGAPRWMALPTQLFLIIWAGGLSGHSAKEQQALLWRAAPNLMPCSVGFSAGVSCAWAGMVRRKLWLMAR